MRVFEVGGRYYKSGSTYEIVKKTAKTIKYRKLQHAGRFNERVMEEKTVQLRFWRDGEVFFTHGHITVEA